MIHKLFFSHSELLTRYNETKTMLSEYEKQSQISSKPPLNNEFPNPQRVRLSFFSNQNRHFSIVD
jgi:hypothetical protein